MVFDGKCLCHLFSIITLKKCLNYFPKTLIWAAQSLDLVAEHTKIAKMWVEVLTHIIQATKSVEMQREHEG